MLDLLKDVKASLEMEKTRNEKRDEEFRSFQRMVGDKFKEMDKLRGIVAGQSSVIFGHFPIL